jgi:hypothetical protein
MERSIDMLTFVMKALPHAQKKQLNVCHGPAKALRAGPNRYAIQTVIPGSEVVQSDGSQGLVSRPATQRSLEDTLFGVDESGVLDALEVMLHREQVDVEGCETV